MNKPAAKEPSMDEILSSIRQIIADDDAGPEPVMAAAASGTSQEAEADDISDISFDLPGDDDMSAMMADEQSEEESEPLALSAEQIVIDDEAGDADPAMAEAAAEEDDSEDFKVPDLVVDDDMSFDAGEPAEEMPVEEPPYRPAKPAAAGSAAMAASLLEPATDAVVRQAFSRLGALPMGAGGLTIENMIREMLRPMLKEWLDENLPGMVQKMVEKEIERLSRG